MFPTPPPQVLRARLGPAAALLARTSVRTPLLARTIARQQCGIQPHALASRHRCMPVLLAGSTTSHA
eukprot:13325611-Alexandrium_andersonii.AAC.1